MKAKHFLYGALMAIAAAITVTACKKSDSAQAPAGSQQNLTLYLTDGPGFFDSVLVDIKSVKVLVDTSRNTRMHDDDDWDDVGDREGRNPRAKDSSLVWQNLNISAGIYDILHLRNGLDTVLASTNIPKGAIRLLKIEIGTHNSLVKNHITYPLLLPSNFPGYVLIKLRGDEPEEFMSGKVRLWLDFDVNRSVYQGYNNEFYLRPHFRFFVTRTTASLSGRVTPMEAQPVLTLFNGKDTAYALPNREGYFKMRGLKDGSYSLFVNASNGYKDTTLTNISIAAPNNTSVGTIALHK
ncbi:protein of unknown function [Hydrobacter penzbergensis]|jgi:hypothetical protein|uniref:DUF4382 domain-containing protein n=1 Tax=Hydrobacter penzbergensis TaxID=1235997 RepID=A0A8X8IG70_9BACT|nr:DUF4382 domain-containing protein [Hydrobacter penzbergensis]MBN8720842.1 DUF4382 domain-containing protein [Sediminibacterium magnilacihabitans]PQV58153.1 uncharacterized protein DUF4382 [Sediminibacterium magnilacihabitans]SDX67805.1 protein of unknown function [Hydrobacter penzbergensis]